jgi:hypothetical protein
MIDTTLAPVAYAILAIAAVAAVLAVAGIVVALRDLRETSAPVLAAAAGRPERDFRRAA